MSSLTLTPERLQAAYDFLAGCPPFDEWNLPSGEDVKFKATRSRKWAGCYRIDRGHQIDVSNVHVTSVNRLMQIMAHEMIHLHEKETGMRTRAEHTAAFHLLAAQVCDVLGFSSDDF